MANHRNGLVSITVALFACFFTLVGATSSGHKHKQIKTDEWASMPIALPIHEGLTQEQQVATNLKQEKGNTKVDIVTSPRKSSTEWIAFVANLILAGFGTWGIVVANKTLGMVRRQTNEMGRQRVYMQQTRNQIDRQASIMEEQTKHLSDSVRVALLSAELSTQSFLAMKSKERARLSIEITAIEFGPQPLIRYKLTCYGTTPAYVARTWHLVTLAPVADFPWTKRDFGVSIIGVSPVVPNGSIDEYIFMQGAGSLLSPRDGIESNVKKGDEFVHVRFWISYRDIFDDTHELYISKIYGVEKEDGHHPYHLWRRWL